jgi:hypothetical protein
MMSETFENFMIYGLESTGEKIRLDITEEDFRANNGTNILNPYQVLVIVKEGLRRIYIWKGVKSPVRKKFIASQVAAQLQNDLVVNGHFHRCKIISVDQGDEPRDFLRAFDFESTEIPEILEANKSEFRQIQPVSRGTTSKTIEKKVYQWGGPPPALKAKSTIIKQAKESDKAITPKSKDIIKTPELDTKKIIEKIVANEVPANFKRQNLILGNFEIYGAVIKKARIFGKEVEEVDWEPVNSLPHDVVELDNRTLKIYFDGKNGKIEGLEILQKIDTLKIEEEGSKIEYNAWTVKELKQFCQENNINIPSSFRKADIIQLINESFGMAKPKEEINYNSWTVKKLKSYCQKNNIKVSSSYRKAEIIRLVKEYNEKKKKEN